MKIEEIEAQLKKELVGTELMRKGESFGVINHIRISPCGNVDVIVNIGHIESMMCHYSDGKRGS